MTTPEPSASAARTAFRLRAVQQYLADNGGAAPKSEIFASVASLLPPDERERHQRAKGQPVWENDLLFLTSSLVRAGWITKDGSGNWGITDAGREALAEYSSPADFYAEARRRFTEWNAARQNQRRAWLVRGSSVRGLNLVPGWLDDGFVSLAGSQLSPLSPDTTAEHLREQAAGDYAYLKQQVLKTKVDELVAFVFRIQRGDAVITSSEGQVYVGDVTGFFQQVESEDGRSNLRRAVEWHNADAPIDYADLPAPLPAAFQTGGDLVELTEHLAVIDALGPPDAPDEDAVDTPGARPPFTHLPPPSQGLAESLFVDHAWLAEVTELLDERRQIIFHGPPGTGKTYIAQKLAAELVGPEQVRLVQFHPAYTYEDFFEGYRPMAGAGDGSIGFELRHGPLRRLVTQAREHPDQAFVLIIDEINRANLAKVFGELYFLLEYRDEAIELLYSPDEQGFTLPRNLFLVGTMNTADRSIALIDAAMRRRFAFVELSPDAEPTRSLLRRWSAHHDLGPTGADLLDALNARIEEPDFRIGPSYFMTTTAADAHSPARLARIWRTALEPLLQEHHYGEWQSVRGRYRLEALLDQVTPEVRPESETESGEPPGEAPDAEPTEGAPAA